MRKHHYKPPAYGVRPDGQANRALRRAYAKGKPEAIAMVMQAAQVRIRAWQSVCAAFEGCYAPAETEEVAA